MITHKFRSFPLLVKYDIISHKLRNSRCFRKFLNDQSASCTLESHAFERKFSSGCPDSNRGPPAPKTQNIMKNV